MILFFDNKNQLVKNWLLQRKLLNWAFALFLSKQKN